MGFETIVRPVVLPNIRPQPWQTRAPSAAAVVTRARRINRIIPLTITDPPEGSAVIHGNPAKQINLTTSSSISITRSMMQEQKRRVDTMRVFQKDENDNVNRNNFVDIDVTNKIWLQDYTGSHIRYYRRATEADNIERQQRDKMLRNEELTGGPGP